MDLNVDVTDYHSSAIALPGQGVGAVNERARVGASEAGGVLSLPLRRRPHRVQWLLAFGLLAVGQALLAGYELGVGNQTIQIPFLRHLQNPALFARDPVVQTIRDYPTLFFRFLAHVVPADGLPQAYFFLHLATTFFVLVAMAGLSRAMFRDRISGVVLVLMLLAGHHRGLAGDEFYSPGFTHTWAVFPLAIAAMGLFYRERLVLAFALVGLIFNVHALTSAYLGFMFAAWLFLERKRVGWRRIGICLGVFIAAAVPTLVLMVGQHQRFTAEWVMLTRIRSADHSFPSSWWTAGSIDIPRFGLMCAMVALSFCFVTHVGLRRKSIAIAAATAVLFVVGTLFSEVWPVAGVLRAQLFRSSRLFMVVGLAHIAWGITCVLKRAVAGEQGDGIVRRALIGFAAAATLIVMALPGQTVLLPWVVLGVTVLLLICGRLSWVAAVFSSAALLVALVAWHSIEFPIPGLLDVGSGSAIAVQVSGRSLMNALGARPDVSWPVSGAVLGGLFVWSLSRLRLDEVTRGVALSSGVVAIFVLGSHLYETKGPGAEAADAWVRAQNWARESTPVDCVFLTMPQPGGFRIHSDRAVVCEWRDGTQAYFTSTFATDWWARMSVIQAGLHYDSAGKHALSAGRPLTDLDDLQLIALAKSANINATHIVLPTTDRKRNLLCVYRNAMVCIYRPQLSAPDDTPDKDRWKAQEQFVQDVCLPNIEKYRKRDVTVQIEDETGNSISGVGGAGLAYSINQTRHAFGFGCSLPFFKKPDAPKIETFMPGQVDPRELESFLKLFNYSQIPFSGKWGYVESVEGKRDYTDLNLYLAFCAKNQIVPEFHFLSGYAPAWLRLRPGAEQGARFLEHSKDMVTRYGDQIPYWQVVNEDLLLEYSPAVFEAIRKINPNIKLGISHCAQFWSKDPLKRDQFRGLTDIKWLKSKGVTVDYFAFHGHRPMGVWPDARDMYEALDMFARENVKIHVSEFTVPQNEPIAGPVRSGKWDEALQAEYYERFYTVCFSHPAVEVINMWGLGPTTWQEGSGLLDENYQAKKAYDVLFNLLNKKWHSQVSGTFEGGAAKAFRGFAGDYEISVTLADGRVATGTFKVPAAALTGTSAAAQGEVGAVAIHLKLDTQSATIVVK